MRYEFSDEYKIKCFEKIASHFYNSNFGQLSKSDIELMMFDFYLKNYIENCSNQDKTIDYNKCSDYNMSKELGITQQRVRNLKVKNQLRNPVEYDWKLSLAGIIKNARYDERVKKIVLSIPDPNLYLEIQNYLEEQGTYIEMQLNNKILKIRPEYFLELCIMLEPEKNQKEIKKALKISFNKNKKDNAVFDEKNIAKNLLKCTLNISQIVLNISGMFSPTNVIAAAFTGLFM